MQRHSAATLDYTVVGQRSFAEHLAAALTLDVSYPTTATHSFTLFTLGRNGWVGHHHRHLHHPPPSSAGRSLRPPFAIEAGAGFSLCPTTFLFLFLFFFLPLGAARCRFPFYFFQSASSCSHSSTVKLDASHTRLLSPLPVLYCCYYTRRFRSLLVDRTN